LDKPVHDLRALTRTAWKESLARVRDQVKFPPGILETSRVQETNPRKETLP